MTPNYFSSQWTAFENIIVQTLDPSGRARRLIPLLLKDSEQIPLRLRFLLHADFRQRQLWDVQLQRLVHALRPDDSISDLLVTLNDLSSENIETRIKAVKWIGQTRNESAIPMLAERLRNEINDHEFFYWIAIALGEIGGNHAQQALLEFKKQFAEQMDEFHHLFIDEALVLVQNTDMSTGGTK
jgi:HEAT repeat protein